MRERDGCTHRPMTQTMKASEARENFSQLLNRVFRGETRVLVEKSGIPVAAIVSAADLQQLAELEAQHRERSQLLERLRAAFGDLSEEEIESDVAAVIARVREERRAAKPATRTA